MGGGVDWGAITFRGRLSKDLYRLRLIWPRKRTIGSTGGAARRTLSHVTRSYQGF